MVCTTFFPPLDFTSFNKIANTIAITKVDTRLIIPIARVFRITFKNVASENKNLKLSHPTKAEWNRPSLGL